MPKEPARTGSGGAGRRWEGRSTRVGKEGGREVREDRVSVEEGEGLWVGFRRGRLEDRVRDTAGVGDGKVAPYQSLASSTFAPV